MEAPSVAHSLTCACTCRLHQPLVFLVKAWRHTGNGNDTGSCSGSGRAARCHLSPLLLCCLLFNPSIRPASYKLLCHAGHCSAGPRGSQLRSSGAGGQRGRRPPTSSERQPALLSSCAVPALTTLISCPHRKTWFPRMDSSISQPFPLLAHHWVRKRSGSVLEQGTRIPLSSTFASLSFTGRRNLLGSMQQRG